MEELRHPVPAIMEHNLAHVNHSQVVALDGGEQSVALIVRAPHLEHRVTGRA